LQPLRIINFNCPTFVILIVVLSLLGLSLGGMLYSRTQPVSPADHTTLLVTIDPGMTTQDIGALLYRQGLIKDMFTFRLFAKLHGLEKSLKAGEYALSKSMNLLSIIKRLSSGQTVYQQITIPEGYTIDQIAELIGQRNLGNPDKFREAARTTVPVLNETVNANMKYPVEGYAFPDTYHITRGTTEAEILAMMLKHFEEQFTEEMRQRAQEMGLSVHEVITLASLVEKEALLPEERPIIAGVFLNRLTLGMPLQSCATIQYILGYPKPELTIEDTKIPSPYNTYQNMGLPPGPIANPGLAAIKAVLYPANTKYLYFVADSQGKHHFSTTYEEHLAMVRQVSK